MATKRYSEISNMDELLKAQRQVARQINKKGKEVGYELESFKSSFKHTFNGVNLIASGLHRASYGIPVDRMMLAGVRFLIGKLRR